MQKTKISINDIQIVDVTPAQANVWLEECNTKNRRMNLGHVQRMVNLMQKGQWMCNGDTVCFDWNGVLVDGQHRLAAIAKSGNTETCIIVRNLDPKVIMTKDMEMKPRNLSDLLSMDGIKDASCCSSIITRFVGLRNNMCVLVTNGGGFGGMQLNRDATIWDKYDLYYQYKDLMDGFVLLANKFYKKRTSFFGKSEIGAVYAYLVIDKNYDEEKITEFWSQLYYGNEKCPAIASLRDKLNRDIDRGQTMLSSYKQALLIKAWNFYIKGSKNKYVNYDQKKDGRIWFV